MKKVFGIILSLALVLPAFAGEKQTPEERATADYSAWLPAAGDWSIGLSLDPFATLLGNIGRTDGFNSLTHVGGDALLKDMVSISGKYMLSDKVGVRANIGLDIRRNTVNSYVLDDAAVFMDPLSRAKVIDSRNFRSNGGSVALGIEYHLGKKLPVQGVFGAGLVYGFGLSSSEYSYGNAITEINQKPTSNYGYTAVAGYMPNARVLEVASAGTHNYGAYGSIGVEWFVAPKIALGANVNIKLIWSHTNQEYVDYEGWNTLTENVENYRELVTPVNTAFQFGTDNIGGNIYMSFYF